MRLHFEHHLKGEPAVPTDLGSCQEILNLSISRCQCQTPSWMMDAGASRSMKRVRPRSRKSGLRACSPMRAFSHGEGNCARRDLDAPSFGERFAGANFPLTQAVALDWIAIQPPLDIKISSYPWDFFSEAGKRKLDQMESDSSLAASHWAPDKDS